MLAICRTLLFCMEIKLIEYNVYLIITLTNGIDGYKYWVYQGNTVLCNASYWTTLASVTALTQPH